LVLHENLIRVNLVLLFEHDTGQGLVLICIAKDNVQKSAGIKARKLESPDTMVIPGEVLVHQRPSFTYSTTNKACNLSPGLYY